MNIRRENPIETITLYKERVTPERARELLKYKNPNNRTLSSSTLNQYVHDIQLGKWDESAISPIVFDRNGILRNGEHRLTATSMSGKTVSFWFAYDAEPTDTFDIGLNRTLVAMLQMRGVNLNTNTVSLVRTLGWFCFGVSKVSSGELERAFLTDGINITNVYRSATKGSHNSILKQSAILAAFYCAYKCGVSLDQIESFSRIANTGLIEELGNNAPVIFRNQIINSRTSKIDRKLIFNITQEAIYDYVNKCDRKRAYTGKNPRYASLFVDGFRSGTLYREV